MLCLLFLCGTLIDKDMSWHAVRNQYPGTGDWKEIKKERKRDAVILLTVAHVFVCLCVCLDFCLVRPACVGTHETLPHITTDFTCTLTV